MRLPSARSPAFDTRQRHVKPSDPGSAQSEKMNEKQFRREGGQTGCDVVHLGDNGQQFLGGGVALDGEVGELLPHRCLTLSQLLAKLLIVLLHLVTGGCQVPLRRPAFCLAVVELVPQMSDGLLRQEGNKMEALI